MGKQEQGNIKPKQLVSYCRTEGSLEVDNPKVPVDIDEIFEQAERITAAYSDHPGFVRETTHYFDFGELSPEDLQAKVQACLDKMSGWNVSKTANQKAGQIWIALSEKKNQEEDPPYAMIMVAMGFSVKDMKRLYYILNEEFDQYDGFEFTLPRENGGGIQTS